MAFELYVNSTAVGGSTDPLGNYIVPAAGHLPEFAVYMVHNGGQPPGRYDLNDTMPGAKVYRWNAGGGTWDAPANVTDPAVGGQFTYGGHESGPPQRTPWLGFPEALPQDPPGVLPPPFHWRGDPTPPAEIPFSHPHPP